MSLVEQELLTLPEHLRSSSVFSGVRVTRSLFLCVMFVDRCLSICTFSFGYCVVCLWIYGFWLPICYLQTLLIRKVEEIRRVAISNNIISPQYLQKVAIDTLKPNNQLSITDNGRTQYIFNNLRLQWYTIRTEHQCKTIVYGVLLFDLKHVKCWLSHITK